MRHKRVIVLYFAQRIGALRGRVRGRNDDLNLLLCLIGCLLTLFTLLTLLILCVGEGHVVVDLLGVVLDGRCLVCASAIQRVSYGRNDEFSTYSNFAKSRSMSE